MYVPQWHHNGHYSGGDFDDLKKRFYANVLPKMMDDYATMTKLGELSVQVRIIFFYSSFKFVVVVIVVCWTVFFSFLLFLLQRVHLILFFSFSLSLSLSLSLSFPHRIVFS